MEEIFFFNYKSLINSFEYYMWGFPDFGCHDEFLKNDMLFFYALLKTYFGIVDFDLRHVDTNHPSFL